jgi:hypothetical protein
VIEVPVIAEVLSVIPHHHDGGVVHAGALERAENPPEVAIDLEDLAVVEIAKSGQLRLAELASSRIHLPPAVVHHPAVELGPERAAARAAAVVLVVGAHQVDEEK